MCFHRSAAIQMLWQGFHGKGVVWRSLSNCPRTEKDSMWAMKNRVYHIVCLEETLRPRPCKHRIHLPMCCVWFKVQTERWARRSQKGVHERERRFSCDICHKNTFGEQVFTNTRLLCTSDMISSTKCVRPK